MLTFCTIVTPSTVAGARVLAAALARLHPGARTLALADDGSILRDAEPFEVLDPARRSPGGAPLDHDAPLRPQLLARALAEGAEVAIFLNPQVDVHRALDDVAAAAREHGVAVAAARNLFPRTAGGPTTRICWRPGGSATDWWRSPPAREGQRFLDTWAQGMARAIEREGRWLDLVPELFGEEAVVTDPGLNVSYWNLHERRLDKAGEAVTVDGHPLGFVDFSGFRADRPYWLHPDANRVRVIDDEVLSELCGDYGRRLRDQGWQPPASRLAGMTRLGNGQRIDHHMRLLWRDAQASGREFGDPATAAGRRCVRGLVARACGARSPGAESTATWRRPTSRVPTFSAPSPIWMAATARSSWPGHGSTVGWSCCPSCCRPRRIARSPTATGWGSTSSATSRTPSASPRQPGSTSRR